MRAKNDKPVRIGVFNPEGSMASAVLGIGEIFELLNQFSGRRYFDVVVIENAKKENLSKFDYVVVPPITKDPFSPKVDLIKALKRIDPKRTIICSVCSGSFQLAHAGIVGPRRVTTHWGYMGEFRERFPSIKLDINEMVIEDRSIITAAGILAYIDLCLYIVKRSLSHKMAQRCAKIILFNGNRTKQSPYVDNLLVHKRNDQETKILDWIDQNLSGHFDVKQMAMLFGMHERTFLRWFKIRFKNTPLRFVNSARLEKAKRLLQLTNFTVNEICYEVGYVDTSSFRRSFKKVTGLSPSEFRNSL